MAKDYFQDIIPPAGGGRKTRSAAPRKVTPKIEEEDVDVNTADADTGISDVEDVGLQIEHPHQEDVRGIRNVNIPSRGRPRPSSETRPPAPLTSLPPMRRSHRPRVWMWVVVGVSALVLVLFIILATRPTVVTIVPRSQAVVFDSGATFVAYPSADNATTSTLSYTVQTIDLDDSSVIPSQGGTTHVETKSSGTITVYNNYSATPVRLIATTRFETPDHLILRTPNDILVPGKSANGPGQVDVIVIADQPGEQYNIASGIRLTVPGLQKSAAMFKNVYATVPKAFAGGFAGERAATDPAARNTAVADIRTRLLDAAVKKAGNDGGPNAAIFPNLMQITYQDLPDTNEQNGVGIHERIHVVVPVLPADMLAQAVAANVTADAGAGSLRLAGGGYAAKAPEIASSTLGTIPLHVSLSGNATLVWNVDTEALKTALLGREQNAFKTIIANFSSIESANARVEPFWKGTFPNSTEKIKVVVRDPAATPQAGN